MDTNALKAMLAEMQAQEEAKNSQVIKSYTLDEFQTAHPGKRFAAHQDMMKNDGTPFTAYGISFGTCFATFSKKLIDANPGVNPSALAKAVVSNPSAYQIIEIRDILKVSSKPIFSICYANSFSIMGNIMLKHKILSDACANNKLIAFRTEKEEWGETIIGHVKELTSQRIIINEIDEYGTSIGTTSFKLDSLIDIVTEDKTLKCLEILEKQNKHLSQTKCTTFWGNGYELKDYIVDRIKSRKPTTFFVEDGDTDDTDIIGFVEAIDEKSVLIKMIDRYGENDGKILVPLETITGIRWDSIEDNARWLLNKYHKDN